jgi:DNA-binding LytR/AlgR family response regulator
MKKNDEKVKILKNKNTTYIIEIDKIKYIEKIKGTKKIKIVTGDSDAIIIGNIKDYEISHKMFKRISRGLIININEIVSIHKNDIPYIILTGGVKLSIGLLETKVLKALVEEYFE